MTTTIPTRLIPTRLIPTRLIPTRLIQTTITIIRAVPGAQNGILLGWGSSLASLFWSASAQQVVVVG